MHDYDVFWPGNKFEASMMKILRGLLYERKQHSSRDDNVSYTMKSLRARWQRRVYDDNVVCTMTMPRVRWQRCVNDVTANRIEWRPRNIHDDCTMMIALWWFLLSQNFLQYWKHAEVNSLRELKWLIRFVQARFSYSIKVRKRYQWTFDKNLFGSNGATAMRLQVNKISWIF